MNFREFYFYNPKLAEDFFLRRNMDSRGFVELRKIAGFDQVSKIVQGLHNVVGLLVQVLYCIYSVGHIFTHVILTCIIILMHRL